MSSRRRPVFYKDLSPRVAPPLESDPHKANLEQLEHFTHEHPLILTDANDLQFCVSIENCSICGDVWGGPMYHCNSECNFLIHKSCAELPERIVNVFHLQHHLCLLPSTKFSMCNICNRVIRPWFAYKCLPCNFILHIKCALQHKFQEPQGHRDHSFILLKPTLFTCDGCGIAEDTIKRVSCLCTTCQFQVHNNFPCSSSYSSFPPTITQIRHSHELLHLYSFQLEGVDFINKICKICNKKMNSVLCVYYCAPCDYIAHVSGATLNELRFEDNSNFGLFKMLMNKNLDHYPEASAPDPIETKEITRHCRGGEDQNVTELQHSSHPHNLILRDDEPKIGELCDGCARPIISIPFYACADQCNFSLHKQCAELPNKIHHPLHRHPLTLHAKATGPSYDNFFGIFECKSCKAVCNGFSYTCVSCNIYIDVGCSLILNPLRHEGHMCPLSLVTLVDIFTKKTKCSACGLDCSPKLVCERCNFNLDYRCASLPKTMSHDCPKPEWGIRPFKLTYGSLDDGSGHYYCDICEELRGQNHWFYYCEDCNYSAHPQCVLSKNLIKYGKTYLSECHPHSLTLVNGYGRGQPPCATCGDPCEGVAVLFCTECNIYIHHRHKCCGFGWIHM